MGDPGLWKGKVTFIASRIFVLHMMAHMENCLSEDFIILHWSDGELGKASIAEPLHLRLTARIDEDVCLARAA